MHSRSQGEPPRYTRFQAEFATRQLVCLVNLQLSGKVSPVPQHCQERREVQTHAVWKEALGQRAWERCAQERWRDLVECPKREALWVDVGKREEPSHTAVKEAPNPGETGGSGVPEANVTCAFKTKSLRSVAPQEGQSFPEEISGGPILHCFQFPAMAAIT